MTTQPLNVLHSGNDSKVNQHLHRPRWVVIAFWAVVTSMAAVVVRYLSSHSKYAHVQRPSEGN